MANDTLKVAKQLSFGHLRGTRSVSLARLSVRAEISILTDASLTSSTDTGPSRNRSRSHSVASRHTHTRLFRLFGSHNQFAVASSISSMSVVTWP